MRLSSDDGAGTERRTGHLRGLAPPWMAGQSGNPSGGAAPLIRMAQMIRETSGFGRELIEFHFSVMRGQAISRPGSPKPHRPSLDQRLQAAEWLASRGWGRAREVVEMIGETSTPAQRLELLRRLSDGERATLRSLLAKALSASPANDATADGAPALEEATTTGHALEEADSERPLNTAP
jgi:hypothetical protein